MGFFSNFEIDVNDLMVDNNTDDQIVSQVMKMYKGEGVTEELVRETIDSLRMEDGDFSPWDYC